MHSPSLEIIAAQHSPFVRSVMSSSVETPLANTIIGPFQGRFATSASHGMHVAQPQPGCPLNLRKRLSRLHATCAIEPLAGDDIAFSRVLRVFGTLDSAVM